jgi:hypothetical protein
MTLEQQDQVYYYSNIEPGDNFDSGDGWEAFMATETHTGTAILVKRYVNNNTSTRKACLIFSPLASLLLMASSSLWLRMIALHSRKFGL